MSKISIGVLGLQGAIEDHEDTLRQAATEMGIEIDLRRVILPEEIESVDGLVMPGGESTAMILIGKRNGMLDAVKHRIEEGMPVFGTCAGAILLSKDVRRNPTGSSSVGAFPMLDITVYRNGYGRQRESFSTNLIVKGLNEQFKGIFIRAPVFDHPAEDVKILAEVEGDPVFIMQDNIMATTFHPELSRDTRIHKIFLQKVLDFLG